MIHLAKITLALGPMPIILTPSIPVTIGYIARPEVSRTVSFWGRAKASAKSGFRYTPPNGFKGINEFNADFEHGKTLKMEGKAAIFGNLRSAMNLNINGLPTFNLGVAVGPKLTIGTMVCETPDAQSALLLPMKFDMQEVINIKVVLGFELVNHIFSLKQEFQFKLLIWTQPLANWTQGPFIVGGRSDWVSKARLDFLPCCGGSTIPKGGYDTSARAYCPAGADITTEADCLATAATLGATFVGGFSGPGDHRYCFNANTDDPSEGTFNTAGTTGTATPTPGYTSMCVGQSPLVLPPPPTRYQSPESGATVCPAVGDCFLSPGYNAQTLPECAGDRCEVVGGEDMVL